MSFAYISPWAETEDRKIRKKILSVRSLMRDVTDVNMKRIRARLAERGVLQIPLSSCGIRHARIKVRAKAHDCCRPGNSRDFIRLSCEARERAEQGEAYRPAYGKGKAYLQCARRPGSRLHLPLHELKECLEREVDLLSRLEYERQKLLAEMEELSKSMNAGSKYRAKFPFPPLPVFFDTTT